MLPCLIDSSELRSECAGNEDASTQRQVTSAAARGQKSVEPNPDEAAWKHVQAQPTEEFIGLMVMVRA